MYALYYKNNNKTNSSTITFTLDNSNN